MRTFWGSSFNQLRVTCASTVSTCTESRRECCLLHKKICLGMKGFPSSMWTRHRNPVAPGSYHNRYQVSLMLLDIDFDGENSISSCCCFAIINKNYDMNSTFRLHRSLTHCKRGIKRSSEDSRGWWWGKNDFVCLLLPLGSRFLCMKVECENKVKRPTGLKMVFGNHILFFSLLFFFAFCLRSSHFSCCVIRNMFYRFSFGFCGRKGGEKEWNGKESEKLSLLECSDNKRKLVRWIFWRNLACWGHEKYIVVFWKKT